MTDNDFSGEERREGGSRRAGDAELVLVLQGERAAAMADVAALERQLEAVERQLEAAEGATAADLSDGLTALAATVRTAQRTGHPDFSKHLDTLLGLLGA